MTVVFAAVVLAGCVREAPPETDEGIANGMLTRGGSGGAWTFTVDAIQVVADAYKDDGDNKGPSGGGGYWPSYDYMNPDSGLPGGWGGGSNHNGSTGGGSGGLTDPSDNVESGTRPIPLDIEIDCAGSSSTARGQAMSFAITSKGITGSGSEIGISWNDYISAINSDPSNEFAATIDVSGGKPYISQIIKGSSTFVELTANGNTFGTIHSHPDGSPPSALDLVAAGALARLGDNRSMAVYCPGSGDFWIVHITDRNRAQEFAGFIASQVDPVGHWWINNTTIERHLRITNNFGSFPNNNEKTAFEIADILENFDSGMKLVKVKANNTAETYGVRYNPSSKYPTPIQCK